MSEHNPEFDFNPTEYIRQETEALPSDVLLAIHTDIRNNYQAAIIANVEKVEYGYYTPEELAQAGASAAAMDALRTLEEPLRLVLDDQILREAEEDVAAIPDPEDSEAYDAWYEKERAQHEEVIGTRYAELALRDYSDTKKHMAQGLTIDEAVARILEERTGEITGYVDDCLSWKFIAQRHGFAVGPVEEWGKNFNMWIFDHRHRDED